MTQQQKLLEEFVNASSRINGVVLLGPSGLQISPHVHVAIQTARKLLPLLEDFKTKNHVVGLLHDIYKDLKADIKVRGAVVNGKKHPALDPSLQAYRIIIS